VYGGEEGEVHVYNQEILYLSAKKSGPPAPKADEPDKKGRL
jgi:hypothetical protein